MFQGSSAIRLLVDGTANNGCPAVAMPVIEYSVDGRAFQAAQLGKTGEVYAVPLAAALETASRHRLELHFRSAGLGPARWEASTVHLRLAGIELEAGGALLPCPERSKKAIVFGDSITEGVCVEGLCASEWKAAVNARRQAGDGKVHLIDTAPLEGGFAPQGATQFAPDGVHPSCYGNAMLGAFVAVQTQKIVSEAETR
jgi:hypothetical protein